MFGLLKPPITTLAAELIAEWWPFLMRPMLWVVDRDHFLFIITLQISQVGNICSTVSQLFLINANNCLWASPIVTFNNYSSIGCVHDIIISNGGQGQKTHLLNLIIRRGLDAQSCHTDNVAQSPFNRQQSSFLNNVTNFYIYCEKNIWP